jgi:hypothetical protein
MNIPRKANGQFKKARSTGLVLRRNPSKSYEVYVGNVGMVYEGASLAVAKKTYSEYVAISKSGFGRAGGESVALMVDGEPIKDYQGKNDRYENPDWAAMRASAAKHGRAAMAWSRPRAAKAWEATKSGSKKAYAWSKPHAAKAWEATKAGTKRAAIATAAAARRGAKKAAPHVARGLQSLSQRASAYAVANPSKCLCHKNPSHTLHGAAKADFVARMAAGRRRAAKR